MGDESLGLGSRGHPGAVDGDEAPVEAAEWAPAYEPKTVWLGLLQSARDVDRSQPRRVPQSSPAMLPWHGRPVWAALGWPEAGAGQISLRVNLSNPETHPVGRVTAARPDGATGDSRTGGVATQSWPCPRDL